MNAAPSLPGQIARSAIGCFSLAFIVPGLAIAVFIGVSNFQVMPRSQWEMVEAVIDALPSNKQSLTGNHDFRYHYFFRGQSFQIEDGAKHLPALRSDDTLDEWQRAANKARKNGQPVPCWVNPADPIQHTLFSPHASSFHYFMGIFCFSHGLLGFIIPDRKSVV